MLGTQGLKVTSAIRPDEEISVVMPLKFPTARLYMHELLTGDSLTGAQAIAEGACKFGLIAADSVENVLPSPNDRQCYCLETAKNVVKKHFEGRTPQSALPEVDHEEVWSAIERHFRGCPPLETVHSAGVEPRRVMADDCQKHAPALFDVMLQQIMRYP